MGLLEVLTDQRNITRRIVGPALTEEGLRIGRKATEKLLNIEKDMRKNRLTSIDI